MLAGKRLLGSRFVTATSRIRFVQKLFQIGHTFLVRPYLLPAFFTLFYQILKFRQFLFGYVPVDDLLPVSPDKVMINVLFSLILFPADIEGAPGIVFYLGEKGLDDLPAAPVFVVQHPMDNDIFFRYFHG